MAVKTTTKEMIKERMLIRKDDPDRAGILLMIIDTVKKSTFDQKREETPADIANAAKKLYEETKANIEEYKKNNADTAKLERELKILEPYLPDTLSQEAMEEAVKKIIAELPEDQRVMKNIMPEIKEIEGFDMKAAKPIIDKVMAAK
jgi:uncharacterized protein YqeY